MGGVMPATRVVRSVALLLAVGAVACGGGSSSPTTPTPPSTGGGGGGNPTITITSAGASPSDLTLSVGQRVTFTNNDSVEHQMFNDPHPSHDGNCPELNQIGSLRSGQSKESGNFVTAKTCTYHDHLRPASGALQGRIVIR
jgi:plastocyanin